VLSRTSSGGACVNHTLLHFTPHELPFGGVGPSGMGRYHGKAGFEAFSNMRGILRKPTKGEHNIAYPPYTENKVKLLRKLT
jgi:aldehyde dehydrogenase (NAD+)